MYTTKEFAERVGVTPNAVQKWAKEGKVKFEVELVRGRKSYLFSEEQALEVIEEREKRLHPPEPEMEMEMETVEVIDSEDVMVIESPPHINKSHNQHNNFFREQAPRIGQFEKGEMEAATACVNWKNDPCSDPEELILKFDEYFRRCIKYGIRPTVEGLYITAGVSADTFNKWERNISRANSGLAECIKKAKRYVNYVLASMASTGKVQPLFFIFYAKNHFGYVDKVEHVIAESNPLLEIESGLDLQKRISESIVIDEEKVEE
ncbi:MAG: MerR family transcriptional regulator [Eubacterium sp.]